jgi:hypothetical protein
MAVRLVSGHLVGKAGNGLVVTLVRIVLIAKNGLEQPLQFPGEILPESFPLTGCCFLFL